MARACCPSRSRPLRVVRAVSNGLRPSPPARRPELTLVCRGPQTADPRQALGVAALARSRAGRERATVWPGPARPRASSYAASGDPGRRPLNGPLRRRGLRARAPGQVPTVPRLGLSRARPRGRSSRAAPEVSWAPLRQVAGEGRRKRGSFARAPGAALDLPRADGPTLARARSVGRGFGGRGPRCRA